MNPPPLLVQFEDVEQALAAMPAKMSEKYKSDFRRLADAGLPPLVSISALAVLFGYSAKFSGALVRRPEQFYRTFKIRKRRGHREINAPRVSLKVIQKWLAHFISQLDLVSRSAYGFVPGKSHILAASKHCECDWVFSIDIRNFFPSVSASRVCRAIESLGYAPHSARTISSLCCYNGGLSQGSPASPVISNLVLRELDEQLFDLSIRCGIVYTRYADDIVFSGKGECPQAVRDEIKGLVSADGWVLAEEKEHYSMAPCRLKVNGLLVNGLKPRLTKGYRNRIRAYRHLLLHGKVLEDDAPAIRGHLAYSDSVSKFDVS